MQRTQTPLGGTWEFELDPYEKGIAEQYCLRESLDDEIQVPGCWQTQNKRLTGELAGLLSRRGSEGVERWKTVDGGYVVAETEYYGAAWYAKNITVPESAKGREVWLVFPGLHAKCELWLDDTLIACHEDGPFLPLRVRITDLIRFGQQQRLTLRFCEDASILQGVVKPHFRGVWRTPYIEYANDVRIDDLFARGDPFTGEVNVEAELDFTGGPRPLGCRLFFRKAGEAETLAASGTIEGGGVFKTSFTAGGALPWTPETPNLYHCRMEIGENGEMLDETDVRFGFRRFETRGRQILLNGKPIFMRGCGWVMPTEPEDFAPSVSREYHERLAGRIKEYGFNWFRIHSAPSPDIGLDVADEMGLLYSQELFLTLWETERERAVTRRQWSKLIKSLRNHPCVWLWSMGNEQGCSNPVYNEMIAAMYREAKQISPQTLVTFSDGVHRTSFYRRPNDVYMVSPGEGVTVGSALDIAPSARLDVSSVELPLVVHELGYVESLPHPRQFGLPRDGARFPAMAEMRRLIQAKGLSDETVLRWSENSERMVTNCYYYGMENLRKVDGLAGYNQWVIMDGPVEQSGLLDHWLNDKTGMTAEKCRRVNGVTSISMTPLRDRYTLFDGEAAEFSLHISHHGEETLRGTAHWRLTRGGEVLDTGSASFAAEPVRVADIRGITASNPARDESGTLLLEAWIDTAGGRIYNEWKFWSFVRMSGEAPPLPVRQLTGVFAVVEDRPAELFPYVRNIAEGQVLSLEPPAVLLVNSLVPAAVDFLLRGGRVVYCPVYYLHSGMSLPSLPSGWNNRPTWAGLDGNFGSVVYGHEVLESFPHEGWADYNFYDLMSGARVRASAPFWSVVPRVFDLDAWPVGIEPIIRSLGYATKLNNRGYMFEARVGEGKLFAASLRLYETLGTHPESQRLFESILRYTASDAFDPKPRVSAEEFRGLLREQGVRML
ncbi:MAG: hypothetical protein FWC27_07065 [Firmicutes bacterium]|nr:hypothetical protein [Bacillota bacterium]